MTPWVLRLIAANVGIFFLQQVLPTITAAFALYPAALFVRPWTAITYMFLHGGLGHLFFNMLGLFFFGPRVEERLGSRRFMQLYLISGVSGALLSLVMASNSWIVGASGALYGVLFAFARFWPRERIYLWGVLPVEAWLLIAGYAAMDLFGGIAGGSRTAHFAHLGGFVGAWLYLLVSERRATAPRREWQARVAPPAVTVDTKRIAALDLSKVHEVNREELNRILDKISSQGMESLSSSERIFLSHFAGRETS